FRWGPKDAPSSTAGGFEAAVVQTGDLFRLPDQDLQRVTRAMKVSAEGHPRPSGMGRLIGELLRPYRGWLAIILLATAVETAMGLAAPWPLKIVLDNVIGGDPPPGRLGGCACWLPGDCLLRIRALAGIPTARTA